MSGEASPPASAVARMLRGGAVVGSILALVGAGALWIGDALNRMSPSSSHQERGAWPLILIGLAYISLQLALRSSRANQVKGILLGVAFVLWGGEQLLPPSRWVTAMDSLVITIFVADLALIIKDQLKTNN